MGFFLASFCLKTYVNLGEEVDFGEKDPRYNNFEKIDRKFFLDYKKNHLIFLQVDRCLVVGVSHHWVLHLAVGNPLGSVSTKAAKGTDRCQFKDKTQGRNYFCVPKLWDQKGVYTSLHNPKNPSSLSPKLQVIKKKFSI